jgi:NAD(P)-dependent dehydrogenase (short-subunit alcohol dehydrogenase family)
LPERTRFKRPGRRREVRLLALYLASDASDYLTGQTILLDGGLGS